MTGAAQAQDHDAQVLLLEALAHLLLEEVRGAEEELALHVDDRDLGVGAGALRGELGQAVLRVERVLHQLGRGRLAEGEGERGADPEIDRGVQRQQQRGREREAQHDRVGPRRAGGDADVRPLDHPQADQDQRGGEGGDRDMV